MKNIIKLGLILGLFAVVSCALLAVVNNFTAPVIKKLEAEKEQQALKMVLPSASQYIAADSETVNAAIASSGINLGSTVISGIFKAVDENNETIGYAANITGPTFETSTILLGMDTDMTITGINILKTTDTPGSQKMKDYKTSKASSNKSFTEQFAGVKPFESFEDGKDYETISGATLSSAGISNMIKLGIGVIKTYATKNK
ncbi:MAG: FMN-binding protein [Treponema sp.]|uniref:FMN-binding protein n=1 Tax=Treponema sp. TaxID=166 RepID=UPI00298EB32D|nr:FMN-binding protein [Treponema sp.]MDD5810637.1 FMN-binding protein [Treponema sp.]